MSLSNEWKSLDPNIIELIRSFHGELPVPVGRIAKALDITVLKSTLPGSISGEIRESEEGVVIKVNRHDVKERQRFTIAHEIAHFLLHRDRLSGGIVDDVLYRSRLSDKLEWEANRLAADIIMPIELINSRLSHYTGLKPDERIKKVAEEAHVSLAALKIRTGA